MYGIAVRHERERGAAEPGHLERRREARPLSGDDLRHRPGVAQVAGPLAVRRAPERVDGADELGVEPDAGAEREPPPVDAPERDAARLPARDALGGSDRIARKPERPRQDAGAAARHEAERRLAVRAVDRFVEAAVAREHVDRVGVAAGLAGELGRVAAALGASRPRASRAPV